MDCEEFKKIRNLHIILYCYNKIYLEKSDDNIKPEDADRKYVADVFNAFPAVSFTLEFDLGKKISSEKVIQYHKKYPNVVFKYSNALNRTYSAFCEHLE